LLFVLLSVFVLLRFPRFTPHSFFLYSSGDHRDLHSFPTRRSSDLHRAFQGGHRNQPGRRQEAGRGAGLGQLPDADAELPDHRLRSEEHTSELQSRENLVCRLLLEKKKKTKKKTARYNRTTVD